MARMTTRVSIVLILVMGGLGWAQTNQELAQENAQLKGRVENLERQVQAMTGEQGTSAENTSKKKTLWSNLDVQFYGYLKADAAYDNSQTHTGNFVVWANNEGSNSNDDEFNLTANESRLGFKINGPQSGSLVTSGQVEFDFFGSPAAENKARIQMRHAFVTLAWPESDFSILAGQTWDVISPLNPTTLNYTVLWDVGNIGYRRPQIRVTKEMLGTPPMRIKLQGAITRTIGRENEPLDLDTESGEDAGFPTVQGRVGLQFPWLPAGATVVGVSGHYGQEEYDINPAGNDREFDSWSINLDLLQPITPWLSIKAELFNGENLGTYFGGIGQGVQVAANDEIGTTGGWCAASLGPWDQWSFNVGLGIDDPDDDDLVSGDRSRNQCIFGNAIYAVNKNMDVGVELSDWNTDYKGAGDADDVRLQASFKYKF